MMQPKDVKKASPRRVLLVASAVVATAIGLAAFGVVDRAKSRQELTAWTDEQAAPTVQLVAARDAARARRSWFFPAMSARSTQAPSTPGQRLHHSLVQGYRRACEERRSAGADRRARSRSAARRGEGAAVQLQAAVQQAQANESLGRVTDQRTSRLVAQGWTSAQQGDTDRLTLASRVAALEVAAPT